MKKQFLYTILLLLAVQNQAQEPVNMVYPLLDAANSRWFFFSSACRPFGMVNLSPDTELGGAWGSGYRYHTEEVKGFSHIHAWQLSGLSVMPVSGNVLKSEGSESLFDDYYSPFSHDTEVIQPGYHSIYLDRYNTRVELSASTRVGFHRYQFPTEDNNAILLRLNGPLGPSLMEDGELNQDGPRVITGKVVNGETRRRPKKSPVFFHIRFNTDISEIIRSEESVLVILKRTPEKVLMKVGISYVSTDQACLNLEAEVSHWDFDRLKEEASDDWNAWLSRILVEGGDETARKRFYTDLWHALQGRRIISDANGKYQDMTGDEGRVGQIPLDENGIPLYNHHNSDSFWGAQWTISTLWHLVYPGVSSDFCNSLLAYYRDGGLIPRGPSGGNYTYVMTGASSTPFLVSAWQKGIRDFDMELAYEGLKKNHMSGGIMDRSGYEHLNTGSGGVDTYIELGYVPYPYKKKAKAFHKQGAGQTLEYASQDWALAQLALGLGKDEDYHYFMKRSKNYRNVYDSSSGYMRPRDQKGNWLPGYDPGDYEKGFVESNGYQGTWYVPHDIPGLAQLMGGKEKLIERLDSQFEEASLLGFTSGKKHAEETKKSHREIPVNYGNQPSIHMAYIFNEAGAPHLTQKWSRAVVDSVYSGLSPEFGYSGDEDQGLMGSLAVLMKIGLFQLNGGCEKDPIYQIGSPIFDRITIQLDKEYYPGKSFVIETENNTGKNCYIQSMELNDKPLEQPYLRHSEIIHGGHLKLIMAPRSSRD